tara:strand:+ start:4434 stop:5354 length:921 start_codon:yes stop_codon:yes gene_type:complete
MKNVCVMPLASPSVSISHLERCVWSIEAQNSVEFDHDIVVVVNSLDDEYTSQVKATFSEYDVFDTASNGKSGKGHNARYDVYRDIYKDRDYTHVMGIDGDDYYYPMALDCVKKIHDESNFDYLSGTCPFVDTVRRNPPADLDPRINFQIADGIYIHSFFDQRFGLPSKILWDGQTCLGGEPPLCLSNKAVECELRYLDDIGLADDYPFLCQGVAAHLRDEMKFVGTDCNDIYVYDCLDDQSSSRQEHSLDPNKGWPFDADGFLEKEIQKEIYQILSGVKTSDLPFVSLPQIWDGQKKGEYVLENMI